MKKPSKAIILARGLGTRMRAEGAGEVLDGEQRRIAEAGIKTLVPILDGKTLLDFILENLSAAGFTQFCLVIGDEHQVIREFCVAKPYDISFAIQKEPLGTADAVLAAASFASGELFLSVNSDNLYPVESLRRLREKGRPGLIAFEKRSLIARSNIEAGRISKFAEIGIDQDGFLSHITEKPETPAEDGFVSMNAWVFSPKIFQACRSISKSVRGEYELADAVTYAIGELGEKFIAVQSDEGVLDLSSRADVKEVSERLKVQQTSVC